MTDEKEGLWTRKQAADYLQVSERTVLNWRVPDLRLSKGTTRYDPATVRAWAAKRSLGLSA